MTIGVGDRPFVDRRGIPEAKLVAPERLVVLNVTLAKVTPAFGATK